MKYVMDDTELEGSPNCYYLRSKFEPTLLIHCRSGELFARRDGAKWEHPSYHAEKGRDETNVDRRIGSAFGDLARYTPTTSGDVE